MLIEVLGPSGVGKTSILKNINNVWKDKILFPQDIDAVLTKYWDKQKFGSKTQELMDSEEWINRRFVEFSYNIIAKNSMSIRQKFTTVNLLHTSCNQYLQAKYLSSHHLHVIHDELLVHRANSFLHYSDRICYKKYFNNVPIPDVAIVILASVDDIYDRIQERNIFTNCYINLDHKELKEALNELIKINSLAAKVLSKRGARVEVINTSSLDISKSSARINDYLSNFI